MASYRKSILLRTFIQYLIISVVFFGLVLLVFAGTSSRYMKSQLRSAAADNLEVMQLSIDQVFADINNIIYMLGREPLLFSGDPAALNTVLKDYRDANAKILSLLMIIENGQVTAIDSPFLLYGIDVDESFYLNQARPNKLIITEPYYSSLTASRTVGFLRTVTDAATGRSLLLVIEIKARNLFELLTSRMSPEETLVVLSPAGSTIYMDYTSSLLGSSLLTSGPAIDLDSGFKVRLDGLPNGVSEIDDSPRKLLVEKSTRSQGWVLYLLVNYEQFYTVVIDMTLDYLKIALLAIAVLALVSYFLSIGFVQPIKKLALTMDRIKSSDAPVTLQPVQRQDEIGSLWSSFINLMGRLKQAMNDKLAIEHEQYELEYKVLQSQIQPHFLLNTLICIISYIENGQVESSKLMLKSLNTLLSSSIDKTYALIPFEQEIASIQAYVTLQKLRMGDTFDFIVGNWEPYRDVRIPKLLLQPVVENAIYHGIYDIAWRGRISIDFFPENDLIHILITDNGRGISAGRLEELNAAGSPGASEPPGKSGMVSIGLSNVEKRIRNYYGNLCGVYISSRENIGTKVELVIRSAVRPLSPAAGQPEQEVLNHGPENAPQHAGIAPADDRPPEQHHSAH